MYKLTARQILIIALVSGLFAAGIVALMDRLSNRFQPAGSAFSEKSPGGITDPTEASDEQNNIEIYRTLSPGVVNVHSTSYARDFFGFVTSGRLRLRIDHRSGRRYPYQQSRD